MNARAQLDTWREFLVAVGHVAEIEQPSLTLPEALTDAIRAWLDDDSDRSGSTHPDQLRNVLAELLQRTPEAGAPGGRLLGDVLAAAVVQWTEGVADTLNDGHPFVG